MCTFRSAQQLLASMSMRIVHGEHHQLTHSDKAHRIAAKGRVREQCNEVAFQLRKAEVVWGPVRPGVEV